MNKTEARYAEYLERLRLGGEILYWEYEPITLRIGGNKLTTYTPDFLVITSASTVHFHEVKGFWRDDARVKIKVAAAAFPFFRFASVRAKPKKEGGGWEWERVPCDPLSEKAKNSLTS